MIKNKELMELLDKVNMDDAIFSITNAMKIAEHYGWVTQSIKAIEEMSELTKALTKIILLGESKEDIPQKLIDDLKEELADVGLMLIQIRYLFNLKALEIDQFSAEKVKRTLERIRLENQSSYRCQCNPRR